MVLYFHTESPPPTETASEDDVIFNRILQVNKGNATKALLLLGGDGEVQCLVKICASISPSYTPPRKRGPDRRTATAERSAGAPWLLRSVVPTLKMTPGVEAPELSRQLLPR